MDFPESLKYTKEHEWSRIDGNRVVVGITDFAQDELGDVVFVELPAPDSSVEANVPFGVVESVKAVSDLFSPITGTVVEVNINLENSPELVNESPYDQGWMIVIEASDPAEFDSLLDASAYQQYIQEESE